MRYLLSSWAIALFALSLAQSVTCKPRNSVQQSSTVRLPPENTTNKPEDIVRLEGSQNGANKSQTNPPKDASRQENKIETQKSKSHEWQISLLGPPKVVTTKDDSDLEDSRFLGLVTLNAISLAPTLLSLLTQRNHETPKETSTTKQTAPFQQPILMVRQTNSPACLPPYFGTYNLPLPPGNQLQNQVPNQTTRQPVNKPEWQPPTYKMPDGKSYTPVYGSYKLVESALNPDKFHTDSQQSEVNPSQALGSRAPSWLDLMRMVVLRQRSIEEMDDEDYDEDSDPGKTLE